MNPTLTCYECGKPTADYYVDAKGQVVCKSCHEMLQARKDRKELHRDREIEQ